MTPRDRGCEPQAPLALASWGSFHVGGKLVELSGRPVREVVFTPGGVPAKVDPNGTYMAFPMYAHLVFGDELVPPLERGGHEGYEVGALRAVC